MNQQFSLQLPTDAKENEFFEEDAISKSTIQALNNSFDKQQLDEQIERPFTPSEEEHYVPPQIEKEQCPNCSRSFFKGRLAPHLRSCTPQRPLKKPRAIKPQTQTQPNTHCPHCNKKLTIRRPESHIARCPSKPPNKALERYQKYVAASINEEVDAEETQQYISQKELSNSQPSFLPKIAQAQNLLSRSVPIQRCPVCEKVFEQRAAQKHIPACVKLKSAGQQRALFCTNCGSRFADQHKYCGVCGKKRM